ncbi:hypothetical protein PYCCODRAFT_686771 [Trametes coccinea BRFM310]|uniref:Uncharacterized protein n=1 Tax=Trametes coccinea (strain BRFM310) TaxID=1353009 RepID=A0A1Y2IKN8_TRAC3|nr:hypothetical protein PYCCODRAFT_686771 [Trametes coccinea BRFM310]
MYIVQYQPSMQRISSTVAIVCRRARWKRSIGRSAMALISFAERRRARKRKHKLYSKALCRLFGRKSGQKDQLRRGGRRRRREHRQRASPRLSARLLSVEICAL